MSQPEWILHTDLGDIGRVYTDATGVYPPEAEVLDELPEEMWLVRECERDDPEDEGPQEPESVLTFLVYRVNLDSFVLYKGRVGSFDYKGKFHREWFEDDAHDMASCDPSSLGYCKACRRHVSAKLTSAAECCDHGADHATPDGKADMLRTDFTSKDPLVLFWAYWAIASYHGWNNFDGYPLELTERELDERWKAKD